MRKSTMTLCNYCLTIVNNRHRTNNNTITIRTTSLTIIVIFPDYQTRLWRIVENMSSGWCQGPAVDAKVRKPLVFCAGKPSRL